MSGFIGENRLRELLTLIKNKFVQNDQIATSSTTGLVKPDGTTTTVDANGTISATAPVISSIDDINDVSITSPTDGQILAYNGTDSEWVNTDAPSSIPDGGTTGQVLSKHSNTDKDVEWAPIPNKAISQSDFDALSQSEKDNGTAYYIYDSDGLSSKTVMGYTPIGTVISVMGNHAPLHYLTCDGTVYNIADYPELADYFENEFGTKNKFGGDGVTTFAVPDLQGEFLRGSGTNSHTNQGSGGDVGEHQDGTQHRLFGINSSSDIWCVPTTSTYQPGDAKLVDTYSTHAAGSNTIKYTTLSNVTTSQTATYYTSRPTNTSVLYCIATKNIYTNPENIYSTDEAVVGKWIDGKPIYQKTISCGVLPNNTTKSVSHNIENLDYIVSCIGSAKRSTDNICIFFPDKSLVDVYINSTIITLATNNDKSAYSNSNITLQYTKTTD